MMKCIFMVIEKSKQLIRHLFIQLQLLVHRICEEEYQLKSSLSSPTVNIRRKMPGI